MKKSIINLSTLAVAAIALFSCTQFKVEIESAEPSVGVPFEIIAGSSDTKTTNIDKTISWVANDAIALFHAENGSSEYGNNDKFTISSENLASNTFAGTLSGGDLDPAKSYDWYAFYPYISQINTPNNTNSGYRAIGSADKNTAQVQEGNDSMAHLSGQYFPLYGKVTDVAAATTPSITMKPALSIIKVHVTNGETAPLTVNSISIVAAEDIVGQFFISFVGETPVFTARSSYTSSTARLTVNDGSALNNSESADFYIAVKPFTAANGSSLTIAVNGLSKTVKLSSDFTFPAGKITKLNFNYVLPDYDKLTSATLSLSGTAYVGWSDISGACSSAVYAGNSCGNDQNYIQLRSSNGSGIVTTASGGHLNKVVVSWNNNTADGRKVFVYGKNVPYASPAELFDENARGTKIGEIAKGSAEVTATDYYAFIGIVANGGAVFLDEVDVYWDDAKTKVAAPTGVTATATGTTINVSWTDVAENVGSYIVTCSGQANKVVAQGVHSASFTELANNTYTVTVQAVPSDVSLATGTYAYSDVVETSATVTAAVSEVWKLTPLSDITESDVFVIVGTNATSSYAMSNNNGTSSAPEAVEVETEKYDENTKTKLKNSPAETIQWHLSKDDDNYTFYPGTTGTSTWLYCTNTNNGVRVGTNANNKVFVVDHDYLKNSGTSRYVGVYNSSDWRCYTSYTGANIANQTFTFYVLQP